MSGMLPSLYPSSSSKVRLVLDTGTRNPRTMLPLPRSSASQMLGNAARTLSFRESVAYIPCTNALPNVRANVSPSRREKKESTLSSRESFGRLALLKGSHRTAGSIIFARGEVIIDKMDDGMRCSPASPGVPYDLGMYKKRAFAGGAVLGTVITSFSSLRRFICHFVQLRRNTA